MLILCTDTSNKVVSFTLAKIVDGKAPSLVASCVHDANGKMSEVFFSLFESFLQSVSVDGVMGISAKDIDRWVVITGPGSFTGVRIGVAALAGVTKALGKDLQGVSALDAAATVSEMLHGERQLSVAINLKLDEFAYKTYNFNGNSFSDIQIKNRTDLPADVLIVNSGKNSTADISLSDAILSPTIDFFITEPLPLYVRKSEAERNLDN